MTLYCLIHGNVMTYDMRSGFEACEECEAEQEFDALITILAAHEEAEKTEEETIEQIRAKH